MSELSRIAFHRPTGTAGAETFRVHDSEGTDVTKYFSCVKSLGLEMVAGAGFLHARLVFINRGEWTVFTERGRTNTVHLVHRDGYEAGALLEINSIDVTYPKDGHETIEITFDVESPEPTEVPAPLSEEDQAWQIEQNADSIAKAREILEKHPGLSEERKAELLERLGA